MLLQAPPQNAAEAYRIYVFDRLSHHLVVHRFPAWYFFRHVALIGVWAASAWSQHRQAGLWRQSLVIGGAVIIAFSGVAIDQGLVLRTTCSISRMKFMSKPPRRF